MVIPIYDNDPLEQSHRAYVNWTLIIINVAVFLVQINASDDTSLAMTRDLALIPAAITGKVTLGGNLPPILSVFTYMFLHGGWDHILGNMLFLAIFGKNVEDAFGPVRYLIFYFAGGFVAMLTQSGMTLLFGSAADARVPTLGASGAIAAVLGAYFVLYPGSRVRTWIFPVFLVRIPAWIFLGVWFLYQLIEASFGLFSASANGGGVAFFAHVGGFIFGLLAARLLARAGQAAPGEQWRSTA